MLNKRDPSKVSQPALVPLHGIRDKKPRFLDRDSIIVGRAKGCDIGLDAPDISNLHCVISRTPDGFRIRDCGSRSGTKVNGDSVKSATLQDGDVLQLGLFSFTVHVPSVRPGQPVEAAKIERLQKSRRRLAERGLKLRRKLRNMNDMGITRTPTELHVKASQIKSQIRSYDQRLSEMEEAERELEQERDKLRKERETHRDHVQQVERDIGVRLGQADADIRKRWQEFQQRCQQEEARLTAARASAAAAPDAKLPQQLQEQKEELDALARELKQEQERVERTQKHLDDELAVLKKQRQEISTMQEQLNSKKAQAPADQDRLQASLAHVEASLNEQRQTLALVLADMEKIHETLLSRPGDAVAQTDPQEEARLKVIEEENSELRGRVRDLEKLLANSHADNKDLNELCGDHDLLRQLLKDEQQAPPNVAGLEKLEAENQCLTHLLQAKEQEIETLKKEATPVTRGTLRESDLENYEAELNQYRRQLDEDRAKLNAEVEQMRLRNAEVDESVREVEMEMSRERAELARERTRLDRLREEVRIDMERMQRDAPVRESLVGVQKLREEINKGKQATPGNPLNDRLKNFRNRLTD